MKREIRQWEECEPKYMAYTLSESAIYYALSDAKYDIIELNNKCEFLKKRSKNVDELLKLVLNLNPTSGELGEGYCRIMQQIAEEINND